jgi:hypothetical protein
LTHTEKEHRYARAAAHFARGHNLLSEDGWLADHQSDRLGRLLVLSRS